MANFRACSICPQLQVMAMPVTWTKCAPAWTGLWEEHRTFGGQSAGRGENRILSPPLPPAVPLFPHSLGLQETSAEALLVFTVIVLLRQRCTVCALISLVLISVCLQVIPGSVESSHKY